MSSKRLLRWVSVVCMTVTVARTTVLFFESIASVRAEREADVELLALCRSGTARESAKLRSACLAASADRASPLLLKAMVHAAGVVADDFWSSIQTSYGFVAMLLFVVSSVALPLAPFARLVSRVSKHAHDSDDEYDDEEEAEDGKARHVIVVSGGNGGRRAPVGFRRRALRLLRGASHSDVDASDSYRPLVFDSKF